MSDRPSLPQQAVNVTVATVRHVVAGRPRATDDEVTARLAICVACPFYETVEEGVGKCNHHKCGCPLRAAHVQGRNKLRWADQTCPVGKWLAIP